MTEALQRDTKARKRFTAVQLLLRGIEAPHVRRITLHNESKLHGSQCGGGKKLACEELPLRVHDLPPAAAARLKMLVGKWGTRGWGSAG